MEKKFLGEGLVSHRMVNWADFDWLFKMYDILSINLGISDFLILLLSIY